MDSSKRIYKSVEAFFTKSNLTFSTTADGTEIQIEFKGLTGSWICSAYCLEERNQFCFYSNIPIQVPEEKRTLISEFLTRANCRQVIGNWEIDLDSGLIRFKTSIDLEGTEIQESIINAVILPNVVAADKYIPGMVSVLDGELSPKEAITFINQAADTKEDSTVKVGFEKTKPD